MADAFIAGPYTGTFNAVDIGRTEEGFHIRRSRHKEPIHSDSSGEVALDAILMGENCTVEVVGIEFEKVRAAIDSFGTEGSPLASVGNLATASAKALVLTPVGGASATRPKFTFNLAICDTDVEEVLNRHLKRGPVTFTAYPDPASSYAHYTKASS